MFRQCEVCGLIRCEGVTAARATSTKAGASTHDTAVAMWRARDCPARSVATRVDRRPGRRWLGLVLSGLTLFVSGCGQEVVSARTYDCALALHSICNRRDDVRLEVLERLVRADTQSGAISTQESARLNDIIQLARNGDWQQAHTESRQLLDEQVRGR